jgi:hypothetical protein
MSRFLFCVFLFSCVGFLVFFSSPVSVSGAFYPACDQLTPTANGLKKNGINSFPGCPEYKFPGSIWNVTDTHLQKLHWYFPNYTFPDNNALARFQIILWISILLALTLLGSVCALARMQFKKDTMLYSSFNPNWEDRKRR